MAAVQPDTDSRPGSATSLVRTVVGGHLRAHGGWMSAGSFVTLLGELGVAGDRTRTALTRLKAKGVLVSRAVDGVAGYAVDERARGMLERGDRRIWNPRSMGPDDTWFLISFTVPEVDRHLRHQLKRRLARIGCGTVSGALGIGPGYLVDEAELIVADLGLAEQVTLFCAHEIRGATPAPEAIARWWDLPAIAARHETFLALHSEAAEEFARDPEPRRAFAAWTAALDTWRPVPYLDPGLPRDLLPSDWPGERSVALFLRLRALLEEPAARYVDGVVAGSPQSASVQSASVQSASVQSAGVQWGSAQ